MSTNEHIACQLEQLVRSDQPVTDLYELTDQWRRAGVGEDAIETILRFVESDPDVDIGAPGPLVNFVEGLDRTTYAQELFRSIQRVPSFYTVEMVNALLNATREPDARGVWMAALQAALSSPATDNATKDRIRTVLASQSRGGVALA